MLNRITSLVANEDKGPRVKREHVLWDESHWFKDQTLWNAILSNNENAVGRAERRRPWRECIRVSFPVRLLSLTPGGLFSHISLTDSCFLSSVIGLVCFSIVGNV